MALGARQFLRSQGNKRSGSLLQELKRRGVTVTTSEAAELYHRVEPLVLGSAHAQAAQVASAYGGASPPAPPPAAGPAVAQAVFAESRGSRSELTCETVKILKIPKTGASLLELSNGPRRGDARRVGGPAQPGSRGVVS